MWILHEKKFFVTHVEKDLCYSCFFVTHILFSAMHKHVFYVPYSQASSIKQLKKIKREKAALNFFWL